MPEPPTGTVAFLFTDIEGSTRLWEEQPEAMRAALRRHDAILRAARRGHVFKTLGDAFCIAFHDPLDAVQAAIDAQRRLAAESESGDSKSEASHSVLLKVRMALHSGEAEERDGDYFGPPLNRVARLLLAGHGGQILLTEAVRRALPPETEGFRLVDRGEHRLSDIPEPLRIYQLAADGLEPQFPPLRTLSMHPNNLPSPATSFIGRQAERQALRALLESPAVRLVTVTGFGGTGKTRLALEVARDLVESFPEGVWFVDLSPLVDPAGVLPAIARACGLSEEIDGTPLEVLVRCFRTGSALLLLDNLEHLLDAADDLAALLRACSGLRLLVTSRELLHLSAEHEYPLAPLELEESIALFTARARQAAPALALTGAEQARVEAICRQLEGVPLAVELAAEQTRQLPLDRIEAALGHRLETLAVRLRDLPPRHRSLRGAIDWSYDLLTEEEQQLFRIAGVFAGGFTLEAIEAVRGEGSDGVWEWWSSGEPDRPAPSLRGPQPATGPRAGAHSITPSLRSGDVLGRLSDKSLLRRDSETGRYSMLESLRQYAAERLRAEGEEERTRGRHLGWAVVFAEEAEPHLRQEDQELWYERLEVEHNNLLAALQWGIGRPDLAQVSMRIVAALAFFWNTRGHLSEGRRWLEAACRQPSPLRVAARLKFGLGEITDSPDIALVSLEESLKLARAAGDLWTACMALCSLGMSYRARDPRKGVALVQESLALAREIGDPWLIAHGLTVLGASQLMCDTGRDALADLKESLALARRTGDRILTATALLNLGFVAYAERSYEDAERWLAESQTLMSRLRIRRALGVILHLLGVLRLKRGDAEAARGDLFESLRLRRNLSYLDIAPSLLGCAFLAAATGHPRRAAMLFGAAERLRQEHGLPMLPVGKPDYETYLAAARAALSPEEMAEVWGEGQRLSVEAAIEHALRTPARAGTGSQPAEVT